LNPQTPTANHHDEQFLARRNKELPGRITGLATGGASGKAGDGAHHEAGVGGCRAGARCR